MNNIFIFTSSVEMLFIYLVSKPIIVFMTANFVQRAILFYFSENLSATLCKLAYPFCIIYTR